MEEAAGPIVVAAATRIEARAVRRAVQSGATVVRVGVRAQRGLDALSGAAVVLSVGVCGALDRSLRPGDAVIPVSVGVEGGDRAVCTPWVVAALREAAASLGIEAHDGAMLTVDRLATGSRRAELARDGWRVADMETAHLVGRGMAMAAVRVVLDTPDAEIDPEWERPWRALLRPRLWPQAWRLRTETPRFARRAAEIAAASLARLQHGPVAAAGAAAQRGAVSPR